MSNCFIASGNLRGSCVTVETKTHLLFWLTSRKRSGRGMQNDELHDKLMRLDLAIHRKPPTGP
jgi:hypothetical protein